MNFKNIQYFIAIAEEKNISSAARKLYVSQQALSEQLKKLEDEVKTPLIKRDNPLVLTDAGEVMYEEGKHLLHNYELMLEDIQNITAHRRSRITVAVSTYSMPPFMPELLERYHREYPQYDVSVIKRQHTDISHFMNGVDLYISYLPLPEDLEIHPVLETDPLCAAFRLSLAENLYGDVWKQTADKLRKTRDLSLIRDMPFILLKDRHGRTSQDLSILFDEYGIIPRTGFQSESGDLNADMCLKGAGVLIAPQDYLRRRFCHTPSASDPQDRDPMLIFPIQVSGFQPCLAVCHDKGRHLHHAETSFIKVLRSLFTQHPI